MTKDVTILFDNKTINNDGDEVKISIIFHSSLIGSPYSISADTYNMKILSFGEIKTSYNFEDLLLVPTTFQITIGDGKGKLEEFFFGNTSQALAMDKKAEVIVYLNNSIKFAGYAQEDGIILDAGKKIVQITVDPKTDILNITQLFDESGNALNPMGFDMYNVQPIQQFIEKTYQLVNPNLSFASGNISISHDWKWLGFNFSGGAQFQDINTSELYLFGQRLIGTDAATYGVNSAADFLRVFARNFASFTGMLSYDKAFFVKLFNYDAANLQTLGLVLSHTKKYITQKLEYVKLTTHVVPGTEKTYTQPTGAEDPHLNGKSLIDEVFTGFINYDGTANASNTQIQAVVSRGGADDGTYQVQAVSDSNIDSGTFLDNGDLLARFWYNYKGDMTKMRIDEFVVVGVNYDFLKNFNYSGSKYQIISMSIALSKNETSIKAIYLGEV